MLFAIGPSGKDLAYAFSSWTPGGAILGGIILILIIGLLKSGGKRR